MRPEWGVLQRLALIFPWRPVCPVDLLPGRDFYSAAEEFITIIISIVTIMTIMAIMTKMTIMTAVFHYAEKTIKDALH